MEIKFTKLDTRAVTPVKSTTGAAGFDLTMIEFEQEQGVMTCKTGLAVAIPKGYVGLLFPRSSIANTNHTLANCVGVIDSDYRGDIMAKFIVNARAVQYKLNGWKLNGFKQYKEGERIVQLVIVPCPDVTLVEVESLDDTTRGEGGFGSTGQ